MTTDRGAELSNVGLPATLSGRSTTSAAQGSALESQPSILGGAALEVEDYWPLVNELDNSSL